MLETTEANFEKAWSHCRHRKRFLANNKVCNYFDKTLIPVFKAHSAIWILRKAGIVNPEKGVTNNPSESFNAVLHSLKQWKQVPLDVVCVSLFYLSTYYYREVERGFHQCGSLHLKDDFSFHEREPSLMPHMARTVEPKEIVSRARGELLPILLETDHENKDSGISSKIATSKLESQLGLAHDAVANKWVTLAFPGCWVVKGTDGVTAHTVTLFPKETCSCRNSSCYHIMACKVMAGQDVSGTAKCNASLLHHNNRKQNKEKPSGRKQLRKKDFNVSSIKKVSQSNEKATGNLHLKSDDSIAGRKRRKSQQIDTDDDSDFVNEEPKRKRVKQTNFEALDTSSDECTEEYAPPQSHNNNVLSTGVLESDLGISESEQSVSKQDSETALLLDDNKGTRGDSYTKMVLSHRATNVKTNRPFLCSDTDEVMVEWDDLLERISETFPGFLLCNYVCRANVDEEIAGLPVQKMILMETRRSKQIAILRRMDDDDKGVPRVQCISVYTSPDMMELEYHAGTATRSECRLVYVEHCGVQLSDEYPDQLTAALLLMACSYPNDDLSLKHIDPVALRETLCTYIHTGSYERVPVDECDVAFCKRKVSKVSLLCYCFTPWVDGSTSVALYGIKQKQFNVHNCSKCKEWFHKYCLRICGSKVPKRTTDFTCAYCTIPETIPWHHHQYTNTCTVDNGFTIILLHCLQNPLFFNNLGSSDIEKAINGSVQLMLAGHLYEGKGALLDYISSKIDISYLDSKIDFKGNEHSKFLSLLRNISRVYVKQRCLSQHCPKQIENIRHFYTFSFSSSANIEKHLKGNFPACNEVIEGYCAAKFPDDDIPLGCTEFGINNHIVFDDEGAEVREEYYECHGRVVVLEAHFTSKNPWIIPISISRLRGSEIMQIPKEILVYGKRFVLGGYSIHSCEHYTAVIYWHNKPYYYDGIKKTKEQRFVAYNPKYIKDKSGSFAYYFLK
uniref:SWIM-type domain-containing protein n=1 Tax=Amphimedon queenslandica TaxID=400682 RepID=A0A1X7UXJ5_AMPQE